MVTACCDNELLVQLSNLADGCSDLSQFESLCTRVYSRSMSAEQYSATLFVFQPAFLETSAVCQTDKTNSTFFICFTFRIHTHILEDSNFEFRYVRLCCLDIPREKMVNYLQTVETLIRRRILWDSAGDPLDYKNLNGLITFDRV